MEVRAVLDEQQISLKKVLDLKVGDTLMLNAGPDSLIELRAGSDPAHPRPHGPPQRPHRRARGSPAFARRPASRPEDVMSLIAIGMNLLLAGLLVAAMVVGMRLNRRLKALRDSHEGFEVAVRELNLAAVRGRTGPGRPARRHRRGHRHAVRPHREGPPALAAKLEKLVTAAPGTAARHVHVAERPARHAVGRPAALRAGRHRGPPGQRCWPMARSRLAAQEHRRPPQVQAEPRRARAAGRPRAAAGPPHRLGTWTMTCSRTRPPRSTASAGGPPLKSVPASCRWSASPSAASWP